MTRIHGSYDRIVKGQKYREMNYKFWECKKCGHSMASEKVPICGLCGIEMVEIKDDKK